MEIHDVSVVMPCYNAGKTITRAILSICAQSNLPKEVIVVDDCSQDNSCFVIQELINEHEEMNISLIKLNENSGPSKARNIGWEQASSKYIAFLDSDDSWAKDKLFLQYTFMKDNEDLSITGHNTAVLGQDRVVKKDESLNYDVNNMKVQHVTRSMILKKNRFSTPTVMLLRSLPFRFNENRKYSEDYLLWSQIILSGNKAVYIDKTLAYLHKARFGESGLSSHMVSMGVHQITNYYILKKAKLITFFEFLFFVGFSTLKFVKRLLQWLYSEVKN